MVVLEFQEVAHECGHILVERVLEVYHWRVFEILLHSRVEDHTQLYLVSQVRTSISIPYTSAF